MTTQTHMTQTFQQFCRKIGFRFFKAGESTFLANYRGQNGKWSVFCYISDHHLLFSSLLPVTVPREKRQAVMAYVTRANYGLSLGTFEMDLDEGEVRFKTSLHLADGQLTLQMVGVLFATNLSTTDHYLKGLFQILWTDMDPSIVIHAMEAGAETESDEDDLHALLNDVDLDQVSQESDD